MARIKRGKTKNLKRKRLFERVKGYRGKKSKLKRQSKEAILHAGEYAFAGRKNKKRNLRKAWIQKISSASKNEDTSYSRLISALNKSSIAIDRKILADIAQNDPSTFKEIAKAVK
jgi:large subunit ribosomal protein L20